MPARLLRVPSIVFAVNKLDAVADPALQQLLALERANPAFNDTLSVRAWDEAAKAVTTGTAYTDAETELATYASATGTGTYANLARAHALALLAS